MLLNKDFKEFIELLNKNRVKYLIVGGYAVAFHGHPRYTKDLDIWILPEQDNATNLIKALSDFGFSSMNLDSKDFIMIDNVIQLGYPPNRIDLLTSASGVDFEICFKSKIEIEIDNIKMNFIDLENLRKNKHASGRYQDLADLEHLE